MGITMPVLVMLVRTHPNMQYEKKKQLILGNKPTQIYTNTNTNLCWLGVLI